MTEDTTDDDGGIDRRTLLEAVDGSAANGFGPERVADGPGDGSSGGGDDADREPDVRIVDNSESREPVLVTVRYVGGKAAGGSVQQVRVVTKGTNRAEAASMERAERVAAAVETIERLQTTVTGLHEVEASHRGESDVARINVGPAGAADAETIEVHVRPDGGVSCGTAVVCGR